MKHLAAGLACLMLLSGVVAYGAPALEGSYVAVTATGSAFYGEETLTRVVREPETVKRIQGHYAGLVESDVQMSPRTGGYSFAVTLADGSQSVTYSEWNRDRDGNEYCRLAGAGDSLSGWMRMPNPGAREYLNSLFGHNPEPITPQKDADALSGDTPADGMLAYEEQMKFTGHVVLTQALSYPGETLTRTVYEMGAVKRIQGAFESATKPAVPNLSENPATGGASGFTVKLMDKDKTTAVWEVQNAGDGYRCRKSGATSAVWLILPTTEGAYLETLFCL